VNFCTLIDHCITNSPDKIAKSGTVHLAISNHALIYMTHKAKYERSGARIIKTRHMKNLHKYGCPRDLQQKPWSDIEMLNAPNDMWSMWKDMLMQSIDNGLNTDDPGTIQIAKLRKPNVNTLLTT